MEINKLMAGYQLKADKCCLLCSVHHMVILSEIIDSYQGLDKIFFHSSVIATLSLLPHFDKAWDVLPSCKNIFL